MRKTVILALSLCVLSAKGQTLLDWGDQGNGTYKAFVATDI